MAEDSIFSDKYKEKAKALKDRLLKARARGESIKDALSRKGRSGTFASSDRMKDAKVDRGVERGKGDIVKRPDYSVKEYKKPGGAVTEYNKPNTSVTGAERVGRAVAGIADKVAKSGVGEGAIARSAIKFFGPAGALVSMTKEANSGEQEWIRAQQAARKLRKGGAGTYTASYDKPTQTFATKGDRLDKASIAKSAKAAEMPLKVKTPKVNAAAPTTGGQSFKDKMQGRNWNGRAASDKSSAAGKTAKQVIHGSAPKKMSEFERMKVRGYSKEAGMTTSRAKDKVMKERSYKFKDLFK